MHFCTNVNTFRHRVVAHRATHRRVTGPTLSDDSMVSLSSLHLVHFASLQTLTSLPQLLARDGAAAARVSILFVPPSAVTQTPLTSATSSTSARLLTHVCKFASSLPRRLFHLLQSRLTRRRRRCNAEEASTAQVRSVECL